MADNDASEELGKGYAANVRAQLHLDERVAKSIREGKLKPPSPDDYETEA